MTTRNGSISEEITDIGTTPLQTDIPLQSQLTDLESETADVQPLLNPDQFFKSQYHLKRELNARSSPILQLPPELLSRVFCIHVWDIVWDQWTPQPRSPLIFGMVCSSWRKIAWSTPRLWSSIWVDLRRKVDPALVDQWLVRSGILPLSIYAFFYSSNPGLTAVAVLEIFTKYAERWYRVTFDIPLSFFDTFECVKGRLPTLQYLSLQVDEAEEERNTLDMFSIAPQLHAVHLEGGDTFSITPQAVHLTGDFSVSLPTSQLSTLHINNYFNKCLDALRLCPYVVDCVFNADAALIDGLPPQVSAPLLESLTINIFENSDVLATIFDTLTIPAAYELICRGIDMLMKFPHTSFISLISRSSCSLQILSLEGFDITESDLTECFRAVPLLRELSLYDIGITQDIFQMLHPGYPSNSHLSDILLPKLERFKYSGDIKIDPTVLTSFLKSRWDGSEAILVNGELQSVAQFKSVRLCLKEFGEPDPHLLIQLKDLAKEGMEIMFKRYGRETNWDDDHTNLLSD
jgi:hypothetical protein